MTRGLQGWHMQNNNLHSWATGGVKKDLWPVALKLKVASLKKNMEFLRSYRNHCRRCSVTFPTRPAGRELHSIAFFDGKYCSCSGFTTHMILPLPHTYHYILLFGAINNRTNQAHWLSSLAETSLLIHGPLLRERTVTSQFFLMLWFLAYTNEKELALKKWQHLENFLLLKPFSGLKGPV